MDCQHVTWDPYVAAYFAAIGSMEEDPLMGHLCVWVIQDFHLTVMRDSPKRDIHLVVPPASDNRTLFKLKTDCSCGFHSRRLSCLTWKPTTSRPKGSNGSLLDLKQM